LTINQETCQLENALESYDDDLNLRNSEIFIQKFGIIVPSVVQSLSKIRLKQIPERLKKEKIMDMT